MNLEELREYHRRRTPPVDAGALLKLRNLDAAAIPLPHRSKLAQLFPTEDPILREYFKEMAAATRELTPEQEKAIHERVLLGDEEAEKLLVEHYLPLVVAIAWEYRAPWPGLLERIEEGNRWLTRAVSALSGTGRKNIPAYIAEEIRQGVYHCVWDGCQIHFRHYFPMEAQLDLVLSRVSEEDGRIIRQLTLAEDRIQRLLELALEYDVSPREIAMVWTRGIRNSREIKIHEEDSCGKEG